MPEPEEDRAAIVALLTDQAAAWNRGDIPAFMEGYWRSPALSFTSRGKVARGFDETLDRYRKAYPDRAAMGTLAFSDLEVSLLPPDAAWALGRWRLDGVEGASSPPGGVFTLILRRDRGAWRIVHDHTSSDAPPPQSSAGSGS